MFCEYNSGTPSIYMADLATRSSNSWTLFAEHSEAFRTGIESPFYRGG